MFPPQPSNDVGDDISVVGMIGAALGAAIAKEKDCGELSKHTSFVDICVHFGGWIDAVLG